MGGEAGPPSQRDGGQTQGEDPHACRVQPLGRPAGGVKDEDEQMSMAEAENRLVCVSSTAERGDRSPQPSSDFRGLWAELPRLPGEPALQRPQPDRAGPTGEPAGGCGGKWASPSLDRGHRS